MLPLLTDGFANPSGAHAESRRARMALDDARDRIAALLGAAPGRGRPHLGRHRGRRPGRPRRVGGRGRGAGRTGRRPVRVLGHGAPRRAARRAGRWPAAPAPSCARCRPDRDGLVDLDALADACSPRRAAWSRSWPSTTRSGTVQPLGRGGRRRWPAVRPGAVLHTDAVQAVPWLDVAAVTAGADLVSVSAHKFGGPEGRRRPGGARRARGSGPALAGGGQERGRRSGTPNVAGAVGMAAALARHRGRPSARRRPGCAPSATGWPTGCWPRCRALVESGRPGRPGGRASSTCAWPGSSPRRLLVAARRGRGGRVGRAPPARAGPSSRATCWRPWGSTPAAAVVGRPRSRSVSRTTDAGCRPCPRRGSPGSSSRLRN